MRVRLPRPRASEAGLVAGSGHGSVASGQGRRFLPLLRELERGLAAPIPERTRIVAELEADLEALSERLEREGLDRAEAERRAVEALCPDERTLRELERLHGSAYRRATGAIDDDRLRFLERTALALVAGVVLVAETLTLARADLLSRPSPFLWVVLALGAAAFSVAVGKAFQLWVKRDHRAPRSGVNALLALSGATLAAAVCGVAVDLFRFGALVEAEPARLARLAPVWLVRESSLVAVATLIALAGSFAWFVLDQWLSAVTLARLRTLGLGADRPHTRRHVRSWKRSRISGAPSASSAGS